ncbi:hypothetical protein [Caldanaerobius polysaccharolyticus]|uniref:hypothetical protein n=1 Tax=Caldanaerobius polysaccharolyticus TaxID=44256 RepID=UPI00047E6DCB|nr:hypothetical protein [Caldanaerobius polysaccharolyticus]
MIEDYLSKYVVIGFIFFVILLIWHPNSSTLYDLISTVVGSALGALIAIDGSIYVFNRTKENDRAKEIKKNAMIIYNELSICLDSIKKMYISFVKDKSNIIYDIPIRDMWVENLAVLLGAINYDDFNTISDLYRDINIIKSRIGNKIEIEQTFIRFANKVFSKSLIEFNDKSIRNYFNTKEDLNTKYRDLFDRLFKIARTASEIERYP